MSGTGVIPVIDPATLCADCDKPWSEHWGFNCDSPYDGRKWKPLTAGAYPPNRAMEPEHERPWRPYEPCKGEG